MPANTRKVDRATLQRKPFPVITAYEVMHGDLERTPRVGGAGQRLLQGDVGVLASWREAAARICGAA